MAGKILRMSRVFRSDGRALVLALDHGMGMGPAEGLIHPDETIARATAGGVDAVLTTVGVASAFPEAFRDVGLILRLDGAFTILTGGLDRCDLVFGVEAALRLAADAVCCMGFVGGEAEPRTLKYLGQVAQECTRWSFPLMAEMLVGTGDKEVTADKVALAARTGVEAGADFIKTTYVGDVEAFRKVTEGSYRPVLVLGGSKQKELELLMSVEGALAAGAAGAVIGRNIWQHDHPEAMARALALVIHEGLAPSDALSQAGLG